MKAAEILQALSILSGAITATIGVVLWRVKMIGAKELKKIDVSAEWQTQMISRIGTVEADLVKERARNDFLIGEIAQWKQTASKLEWELESAKAERAKVERQLLHLEEENKNLNKQNVVLAKELRELYRQIRGGHQGLSIPPLPTSLQKKKE